MRTLDEILKQASALSSEDRRRLADSLEEGLADEERGERDAVRLAGLDGWLALGGAGHSDFTDVARDKYEHLAVAYSDGK